MRGKLRILGLCLFLLALPTGCGVGVDEQEYIGKVKLAVQNLDGDSSSQPNIHYQQLLAQDPSKLEGISCRETGKPGELEISAID